MKRNKVIYWASTLLFSGLMAFSAINYFINSDMAKAFIHLGFPDYFRVELGIAKIIGALLLAFPRAPKIAKEWSYAGFTITLISASFAHFSVGDPATQIVAPLIILALLIVSYYFNKKTAST